MGEKHNTNTGETTELWPLVAYETWKETLGLKTASIRPTAAYYNQELGEFLPRYEDMRSASSPEQALLEFFRSTYETGATLAKWDREALERRVL